MNGKSFAYCFTGTVVSVVVFWYSFYVPWALMNLDMTGASYKVKVPVLLWQGCFDNSSCMVTPLVDVTSDLSLLEYDPFTLSLLSHLLMGASFLHVLGIFIGTAACSIHLLDTYKIRIMPLRLRYVYPSAVGCYLLSLSIFLPFLVCFIQGGGYLLSGYVYLFDTENTTMV